MSNEEKSGNGGRGRSLSRQILGGDLDLVNQYAAKYNPSMSSQSNKGLKRTATYSNVPNPHTANYGAYGGYGSYGRSAGGHRANHSMGYGSGSSTSSNGSSSRPKNRRQPSNLINPHTANQWQNGSMDNTEQDMSAAMTAMVSSYQTRINQEAEFLDEMESEAESNADFAKPERAEDWTVKEVCYWLNKIHLDKYIKAFRDQIIDGSILLRDLDDNMLVTELGVKRLHVKKIQREIKKLMNKSTKIKKETNDSRDELIQSLRNEIDELKARNKTLNAELQSLKLKQRSKGNLYGGYNSQY